MKYSKELLEPLAKKAICVADVCRELGLRTQGNSSAWIKNRLIHFAIDISHFVGNRRGPINRVGTRKKHFNAILVLEDPNSRGPGTNQLRRAMLESGVEHKCEVCSLAPVWNSQPLVLQIDHRDGCSWNHRPHNVRFICPNCHSQTETFCSKRLKKPERDYTCLDCGASISKYGKRCRSCASRNTLLKVNSSYGEMAERLAQTQ